VSQDQHPLGLLDPELRAAALDVLGDVLGWRLTDRRWAVVGQVVDGLRAALRERDAEMLRASTYDLELAGPVRATPIGDTPVVDAPAPVRVLVNTLIFELSEPAQGEAD
jgi:CATRA-Associated Small Protein